MPAQLGEVNRWLLGYRPTLAWLERLPLGPLDPVHIVDVGSGGGDLLRQIAGWARKRRIAVQADGDRLESLMQRVRQRSPRRRTRNRVGDRRCLVYRPEKPIDIVVSSLMAHHLEDEEIIALLR